MLHMRSPLLAPIGGIPDFPLRRSTLTLSLVSLSLNHMVGPCSYKRMGRSNLSEADKVSVLRYEQMRHYVIR
jgi:hypothetical protein